MPNSSDAKMEEKLPFFLFFSQLCKKKNVSSLLLEKHILVP
jgi:hypothetical protein